MFLMLIQIAFIKYFLLVFNTTRFLYKRTKKIYKSKYKQKYDIYKITDCLDYVVLLLKMLQKHSFFRVWYIYITSHTRR